MLGHRPTDDAPTARIEDDCQIQETRPGRDIGNIRDPESIGSGGREVALDEIWCRRHLGAPACRARSLPAMAALQSGHAKQARDPLARTANTVIAQFGVDARRPVRAAALLMNRP